MIEKERLEELIKQGATIYKFYGSSLDEYRLNRYDNYIEEDTDLMCCDNVHFLQEFVSSITDLFETEEDAEWHKEFKRIPRTDYLDLPTWKELNHTDDKRFRFQSKHNGPVMIWIDIFDLLNIEAMHSSEERYCYEATKENYTLACRKAKELFLGEENVKDN